MTTTSSVSSSSSTAPTVNLGNAQDVSGLVSSNVDLSLADEVTSKVQPYLDQATALQTEINTNNTQIAAYQNMQSLLQSLQTAASNLTTESLEGANVFQSRAADLSSNSATAASAIMTASVASGTTTGTHSIIVNKLAQAEADTSATLALSSTAQLNTLTGSTFNGSITIAESGKTSPQAVSISSAMTLSQVAAAINGASTTNGVTASVVSVDSSHQVLVLTAQDQNQQLNFTDSNSILQALGVIGNVSTGSVSVSDPTAALGFTAGGFTIGAGTDSATVTVDPTTTLNDIITQITAGGQFTASQVNGKLQIADTAGNAISYSAVTGDALAGLGLPASGAATQVTAAQALNLTVDGVQGITRNSNTVSDVLAGVTMNLTKADPNTTVTMQINPDANTAATAVQSFITAYNSWESFVQQNEATDSSGAAAASAVLFGNSSLRDASLQIDQAVTAEVNGTSLGALGISLDGSNQMSVDATTLDDALNNNFNTVANLFQATLTTSSVNLTPSGNNLSSYSGTFTLGITMTGSDVTGLTLNGQATTDFIFAGDTIQGRSGTPYSGMYFTYSGTGGNVSVTSSQGIANQVYSTANNFASTTSGSVQGLITDDQNQNLQFTSQYNNWVNEANTYTDFLLTQYSALTSQIQQSGQTLNTLTALMNAGYNSNG
jgi:flagellar hook-associated protein 2